MQYCVELRLVAAKLLPANSCRHYKFSHANVVSHNVPRALPTPQRRWLLFCMVPRLWSLCFYARILLVYFVAARTIFIWAMYTRKTFSPGPKRKLSENECENYDKHTTKSRLRITATSRCVCSSWVNAFEMFALHAISSCCGYRPARKAERGGYQRRQRPLTKRRAGKRSRKREAENAEMKNDSFQLLLSQHECVCVLCMHKLSAMFRRFCMASAYIWHYMHNIWLHAIKYPRTPYDLPRWKYQVVSNFARLRWMCRRAVARSKRSCTSAAARNAHHTSEIWPMHTRCDFHCQWKSDCAIRVFMRNNCQLTHNPTPFDSWGKWAKRTKNGQQKVVENGWTRKSIQ